ncbi:MAG: hypothetical protein MI861_23170 [Pirellulales bacterium]|nr:hypothetical protein [Pirellulales bacterium]
MNNTSIKTVALGLGSAHGDDQFGWIVLDRIRHRDDRLETHKLSQSVDILPYLDTHTRVDVFDAAAGLPVGLTTLRLEHADPAARKRIAEIPAHGTHDLSIGAALSMAMALGKRTDHLTLWLGRAEQFPAFGPMSPRTKEAVETCVEEFWQVACARQSVDPPSIPQLG